MLARRNQYALEIMYQVNELQHIPGGFFVIEIKYDMAANGNCKTIRSES